MSKKFISLLAFILITAMSINTVFAEKSEFIYGDANNDGVITATDAVEVLQKVLNFNFQTQIDKNNPEKAKTILDVTGDGKITATDVACILQRVLNSDFLFPVEKTSENPTETTSSSGDISNGNCIISSDGDYVIYGTSEANGIEIENNVSANITIKNLNINSNKSPIRINKNAKVNLFLEGINKLKAKQYGYAGIFVGSGAYLTIEGTGSLDVAGGDYASGIGSNYADPEGQDSYGTSEEKGNIEIKSGTVIARGGEKGAGIGGYTVYSQSNGDKVLADIHAVTGKTIVSGGTVTAYGGDYAAGIGGCWYEGTGNTIEFNGGNVTAYGGYWAPGIGFGYYGYNQNRCLNGDIIFNGGTVNAYGGAGAAGIGASWISNYGVNIEIYGGNIYAEGNEGAGINLSGRATRDADCGWLEVDGGVVTAVGNDEVGIYNKYYDVWINSGSVKAIGINGEDDISVRKYINNYKTNEIVNLKKFKAKDVVFVEVDDVDWKIGSNHPDDEYIYLYLPESAKKVTIKTKDSQQEFTPNKIDIGDVN